MKEVDNLTQQRVEIQTNINQAEQSKKILQEKLDAMRGKLKHINEYVFKQ